jgi:hypothetical protein
MWDKLLELDLFNSTKIVKKCYTCANIRKILSDNWTLEPDDKDMIVMYHKFGYELDGAKNKSILKWYVWEDQTYTAMAKNSWFTGCDGNLLILNGKLPRLACNLYS